MIARLLAWMQAREQRRLRSQQIRALEDCLAVVRTRQAALRSRPVENAHHFALQLEADAIIKIAEATIEQLRERV